MKIKNFNGSLSESNIDSIVKEIGVSKTSLQKKLLNRGEHILIIDENLSPKTLVIIDSYDTDVLSQSFNYDLSADYIIIKDGDKSCLINSETQEIADIDDYKKESNIKNYEKSKFLIKTHNIKHLIIS